MMARTVRISQDNRARDTSKEPGGGRRVVREIDPDKTRENVDETMKKT